MPKPRVGCPFQHKLPSSCFHSLSFLGTPTCSGSWSLFRFSSSDMATSAKDGNVDEFEAKLRFIQENVPDRTRMVAGSTAGAGSGDFHSYRQARRKEQVRLEDLEKDWEAKKKHEAFLAEREAREEEERRKREKRKAQREKKKAKKRKRTKGGEEPEEKTEEEHANNRDESA
eukprot:scaffold148_cov341-Pavlova_lutheri.AAC.48